MIGGFPTLESLLTYFAHIETRFDAGDFLPTSDVGETERDRMLLAMSDLRELINQEYATMIGRYSEKHHVDLLAHFIEVRTRIALLLGKFEGFRYGQTYFVSQAGSQYLI